MGTAMLQPGIEINDTYRVEHLIGRGGMACVYLVTHLRLAKQFALKVITATLSDDPNFHQRFRREVGLLSKLTHPNIVSVIDGNEVEGQPYLVMEYLEGEDLEKVLRQRQLPLPMVLALCKQIGAAIAFAHGRKIIHRDLKPANLFLCSYGSAADAHVKVLDFGLARLITPTSGIFHTTDGLLAGTPAYMSPEQARGRQDLDERTDQFSLAVIFWELFSGRRLFAEPGDPVPTILHRIAYDEPPPLPWPALDAVLRQALAKEREHRHRNVSDFVEALWSAGLLLSSDEPRKIVSAPPFVALAPPPLPAPMSELSEVATRKLEDRRLGRWLLTTGSLVLGVLVAYFAISRPRVVAVSPPTKPLPPAAAAPPWPSPASAAATLTQCVSDAAVATPSPSPPRHEPQRVAHDVKRPALGRSAPPTSLPNPASASRGSDSLRYGRLLLSGAPLPELRTVLACLRSALGDQIALLPPSEFVLHGLSALRIVHQSRDFPPQYSLPLETCLAESKANGSPLPEGCTVSIGRGAP